MKLTIYSDNQTEANWFKSLNQTFDDFSISKILARGQNPKHIEEIIKYDRPDIILADDNKCFLVIEKTREVPTGHNIGQRAARMIRSIELNVPFIYFLPFDAMKHGIYAGICHLNIRLLKAIINLNNLNKSTTLAINYKSYPDGELIDDGSENNELKKILSDFISSNYKFDEKSLTIRKALNNIKNEYDKRLKKNSNYATPPNSVNYFDTNKILSDFKKDKNYNIAINSLMKKSLVYEIKMNEEKCRREDPYTGMQFIYYYSYCLDNELEKDKNLILKFPNINKEVFLSKNPNNLNRKSCNWYLIADAMIFKDSFLLKENY